MKFTLSWLKDHLETDASLDEICDRLTQIGLEVEDVDDRANLKVFVIAKIISAQKHPDADKLQVLRVDIGNDELIQVVCGAPNAREGLIGVFAPPGAYVPGLDVTLSVGKIRGVESFGMMCSESELELSNEHNGIIELDENALIGQSFATYFGLDDPIIDVGLTPNRPDCAGVRGIARDLAASNLGHLKPFKLPKFTATKDPNIQVSFDFDQTSPLCLGFSWREVRNIKNTMSPIWMQQRLTSIGLRPINALVDITNYLTFDLARPLHVFDADKIRGNLTVRRSHKGENFLALNGKDYCLGSGNCVISDDAGIQSIAGIIGGEETGCDENTQNVLIESALWDPHNIAQTGRTLGIISDARYRFERGVDPESMEAGLEIASQFILDYCGGEPSKAKTIGKQKLEVRHIEFPVAEIKRLTSLELGNDEVINILTSLGFHVEGSGSILQVQVPTWRPDVEGKADLVEEVMRIHGLDKIIPDPLEKTSSLNANILTPAQKRGRNVRRALASRGLMETVTWSFVSKKQATLFGGGQIELELANPIAADMSNMRPSLLPGLLSASQRNADRGFWDLGLFEVSSIYLGNTPDKQQRVAGGIRRGTYKLEGSGRFWGNSAKTVDVFDAKADVYSVLEACGMDVTKLQIETDAPNWYHPGRSGVVKLGPKITLAHFGEFHPDILDELGVSGHLCGFEVFLDAIPEAKKKPTKTKSALMLSAFQRVYRDFAFVVDKKIQASIILRAANGADKKLIQSVNVFDVFEDSSLGEDKKSVAIEVTFQPLERTLTDDELDALGNKIIENVLKSTGGVLRS
ncbi:phenylalanine--tRNA ligase subunit beta [Bartonella tamiae]|uniref:Phenylalanine--tRNA ligase beta subunit n=1 Tax=Bartonella tamiae Th239 TaxID=1094558 RepID=J0ZR47_9HYPH|nr:phenylalanine--tRNA ligase subunit beta [Bartonella tamiae]EJF91158.1 phenylalanine-tRNA ligase, beta subunit [Bartonella tamiae Th239]EJF93177.1 phenylalanine-tRNA ligase, beta subunit [Bartonella tamiae Th307]